MDLKNEPKKASSKKIGLALGGGGARGLAHIGVIKALEAAGMQINYISGTSMGALVGGFYALTKDIYLLENLFLNLKRKDIFSTKDVLRKKSGALFRDEPVMRLLESAFKDKKFDDCIIPFKAIATDVSNGDEVVMESGSLLEAIRASISLPLIFSPVKVENRILMDGGFVNPVPADVVKNMGAEVVVAVDVSSKWLNITEKEVNFSNMYSIVSDVLSTIEYQISKKNLEKADIVIRPLVLGRSWIDFDHSREIIKAGEDEVKYSLKELVEKTGCLKSPQTLINKFIDFLFGG
ncbi:MAG: putative esterase of the alpha-beta hydrolase superfamily [Parcubacteria group bacterium GW2011_GWA2_39_18]|nr:MAG: putative esterase of the alpha-beta hydrolase superfamily [Parcubacteria group bacterium GW2011_GWA2_39_18]